MSNLDGLLGWLKWGLLLLLVLFLLWFVLALAGIHLQIPFFDTLVNTGISQIRYGLSDLADLLSRFFQRFWRI